MFCLWTEKPVIGTTVTQSIYLALGQSPAATNPIQTPTETMYSNNSSGRAGRHGRAGTRGPGKGRMPGFRSTIHYIHTDQVVLMGGVFQT